MWKGLLRICDKDCTQGTDVPSNGCDKAKPMCSPDNECVADPPSQENKTNEDDSKYEGSKTEGGKGIADPVVEITATRSTSIRQRMFGRLTPDTTLRVLYRSKAPKLKN